MNFSELTRAVDTYCEQCKFEVKQKAVLLELIQKAIDHGESKEQNKITSIIVKGLKALVGSGSSRD